MEIHNLDDHPVPEDQTPLFINEPWLADISLPHQVKPLTDGPDPEPDNVRIYVPVDLNAEAIIRRLRSLTVHYGESNEKNEFAFSMDVAALVAQIEIYDQVWSARHKPQNGRHSEEAVDLVRKFVEEMENIPDGGSEIFPFNIIEELKQEYLTPPDPAPDDSPDRFY